MYMVKLANKNKRWYALIFLLVLVVVIAALELTDTTHFFHTSAPVSAPTKPITELPPQPSKSKNPSTQNVPTNEGSMVDKNGQVPASATSSDPSKWAASSSGRITLKQPTSNSKLSSGGTVSGSAAEGPVYYRIIDDQAGVISQGAINVVDGNFAAAINFTAFAGTGRLDVFNADANGRETNEVQVKVNF